MLCTQCRCPLSQTTVCSFPMKVCALYEHLFIAFAFMNGRQRNAASGFARYSDISVGYSRSPGLGGVCTRVHNPRGCQLANYMVAFLLLCCATHLLLLWDLRLQAAQSRVPQVVFPHFAHQVSKAAKQTVVCVGVVVRALPMSALAVVATHDEF